MDICWPTEAAEPHPSLVLVVMIIAFSLDNEMTMGLNFSKIRF